MVPSGSTLTPTILLAIIFSEFLLAPVVHVWAANQLSITTKTSQGVYKPGEIVQIFGNVTLNSKETVSGAKVAIEVKDPRSTSIFLDIVRSDPNGSYLDVFRLPETSPLGFYHVYTTAHLSSFNQTLGSQTSVATFQVAPFKVSILDYRLGPPIGGHTVAHVNLTLSGQDSLQANARLLMTDPTGQVVFDNFQGIGGPVDTKPVSLLNGSPTQVEFNATLNQSRVGDYSFLVSVYGPDLTTVYKSTPWLPAFFVKSDNIVQVQLGQLDPSSLLTWAPANHIPPPLPVKRYDSVNFTFWTNVPLNNVSMTFSASQGGRFAITLGSTSGTAQTELRFEKGSTAWMLRNLPAANYSLVLTAISRDPTLSSTQLQSGGAVSVRSSVRISRVEPTSVATPGGTESFHVTVEWTLFNADQLNITLQQNQTTVDSGPIPVGPLSTGVFDTYLSVGAPVSRGTFNVTAKAQLDNAGVSSAPVESSFKVYPCCYNITVEPVVRYYKLPPVWQFWDRSPQLVDSASLSALDVRDITVSGIDDCCDASNRPLSVSIRFTAHDKLTGEVLPGIQLGEGVHYEVQIKYGRESPVTLAFILAGDEQVVNAGNIPVTNGLLSFTIIYTVWVFGEILEVAASALHSIIAFYTDEVPDLADFVVDIAKLVLLYSVKDIIETQQGNLTHDEAVQQLVDLAGVSVTDATDVLGDKGKVSRNYYFAVIGALWDYETTRKIDPLRWLYAVMKITLVALLTAPSIRTVVWHGIQRAFGRLKPDLELTSEPDEASTKGFLDRVQQLFSVVDLIATVGRLLTAPQAEGKIFNCDSLPNCDVRQIVNANETAIPVDPTLEIGFTGPPQNTNLALFIPQSIQGRTDSSAGSIVINVDQNDTSTVLPILSDPTVRNLLFSGLGLNATASSLDWTYGTSQFVLSGRGASYPGVQQTLFSLNNTLLTGSQTISTVADSYRSGWIVNRTLTYPFGTNLGYTISLTLPVNAVNVTVLTPGFSIARNTITWNRPVSNLLVFFQLHTYRPTGSIKIDNNSRYTNSTSVTLALTADDPSPSSGIDKVRLSNTCEWGTALNETSSPTKAWTLPLGDGPKTVCYQVIDNAGFVSLDYNATIILDMTKPVANAGPNLTVALSSPAEFDASASTDNFEIASYEWAFGDGTTSTGRTATHTYAASGLYNVTLIVTDAAGNSAITTLKVTVLSSPPPPFPPIWWFAIISIIVVAIGSLTLLYSRRPRKPPGSTTLQDY